MEMKFKIRDHSSPISEALKLAMRLRYSDVFTLSSSVGGPASREPRNSLNKG